MDMLWSLWKEKKLSDPSRFVSIEIKLHVQQLAETELHPFYAWIIDAINVTVSFDMCKSNSRNDLSHHVDNR